MEQFLSSKQAQFWADRGFPFTRLSPEQCWKLEPGLTEDPVQKLQLPSFVILSIMTSETSVQECVGGVLCGQGLDSSGDVHRYTLALAARAEKAGVDIRCGVSVAGLRGAGDGSVAGVELQGGQLMKADGYVLCAGVETARLAAPLGLNIPVYPLKGRN